MRQDSLWNSILELVGNTPLVKINRLNPNPNVEIFAKLEYLNPGGSVKDRAALWMIEEAERQGKLTKDKIILEATSGNTGIGLALVAAVKGYRLILVMPESVSEERVKILKARGAEVIFTPARLSTDGAIEYAYKLAREEPEKYWLADQFNNEANWKAHYYGTAMEIWQATGGKLDMVVATMGTSGTLMGLARRFAELSKDVKIVGVEPYLGHKIQGLKNMKESYVPGIYERQRLHRILHIHDELAYETARELAKKEGILVGMSSGAAMAAAIKLAEELKEGRIVVILPDTGERYLSTPLFIIKKLPGLKIFNTLSRTVEQFSPIEETKAKVYCCGPILNSYLSLNIARRFVVTDVIVKYLKSKGLDVEFSTNFTDIDEKTIQSAENEGKGLKEFSEYYLNAFIDDLKQLGVVIPDNAIRASEYVSKMIEIADQLVQKGYAYEKFRSIYFDISRLKTYGILSKIDLSKIKVGKTVDLEQYEKDNPRDFTLLKRATLTDLKRGSFYETKWGKVRPSWHLECASIVTIRPGIPYDIHISGTELLFPHNENTFAIGYALLERIPCRYWIHVDQVELGQELLKALGRGEGDGQNSISVRDLMGLLKDARQLRYLLVSRSYRRKLKLGIIDMESSKSTLKNLDWTVQAIMTSTGEGEESEIRQMLYDLKRDFYDALDEDLNIPKALGVVFQFMRKMRGILERQGVSSSLKGDVISILKELDSILGIFKIQAHPNESLINKLVAEREVFRQKKDFGEADRIRNILKEMGVFIVDTAKGNFWTWV